MSDRPRRRRRARFLIRLVEVSPLVVVVLAGAVWLSLPAAIASTLLGQTPIAMWDPASTRPSAMSEIIDSYYTTRDLEGLGLTQGVEGSLQDAAQRSWWELQWRQDEYFKTSTITPVPFEAGDKVYADLTAWGRKHGARIWVWVLPRPAEAPFALKSVAGLKELDAYKAELTAFRQAREQTAAPVTDADIPAALYAGTSGEAGVPALAPPALGGVGGGGSSGYMVWEYNWLHGQRVYKYYLIAPGDDFSTGSEQEVARKEAERERAMQALMDVDPQLPRAQRAADEAARVVHGNVFVLGPLRLDAVPLRLPKGATLDQARRFGAGSWPSEAALGQWPNQTLTRLPAQEASLTGDVAVAYAVASSQGDPIGTPAGREGQTAPQTILVAATYKTYPAPGPTSWQHALRTWQHAVASVFPWVAGALAALLAVSLVASPAAFVYDRKRTARDRVLEEMEAVRRDAHDRVYNRLSALSKTVALAGASAGTPEETAARLSAVADDIRGTVGELQDILGSEKRHDNAALTTVPLAYQLSSVCSAQAARHGVEIACDAAEGLPEAPAELGWDLQCVAEEAITNSVRHGSARTIGVALAYDPNSRDLTLRVVDDGSGSRVTAAEDAPTASRGLRSMHERVSRWNGSLSLGTSETGTSVVAVFRLPRPLDNDA